LHSPSFLSYSALNNTLVIDITHIDYVSVSSDLQTATVGAGIRFGSLYTALDAYNRTFTGGICPTVALSGFLGSGGFNMQMRQLGMGVDHIVSAKVVTADGDMVTASTTSNPSLFWAIRGGGGGSYGIVVEWQLQILQFPRSAMFLLNWTDPADRFPATQRFLEWGPAAPSALTSQINVYRDYVQVVGWYYGQSADALTALVNSSGLLSIGNPAVYISGGCNTDNARMFSYVGVTSCEPDDDVEQLAPYVLNTIQQPFTQVDSYPQFTYNETTHNPSEPTAAPWQRFRRMAKSFFVQKSRPMDAATLQQVVDRIAQLDEGSQVWGEWHAWNLSSSTATPNAFGWREQAAAHLEFQIHGSEDAATQEVYQKWMDDLESLLRPALG
jgi:FAD/FMN-containing dehydrogenase